MSVSMLSLFLLSAVITVTPGGGAGAFEKARDAIRASGQHGSILIRASDHFVDHTIALDARDPRRLRLHGGTRSAGHLWVAAEITAS